MLAVYRKEIYLFKWMMRKDISCLEWDYSYK